MLLGTRAATRQLASSLHGATVSRQSLCSLHLPNGRIPAGRTQETDVDHGSGTVRMCYAHLSCLACLSFRVYCKRCGWTLDFKDVCRAMTVVALIIAVRRAFVLDIAWSMGAAISFQNRHTAVNYLRIRIRKNCGKVRGFGCELEICNNTKYIYLFNFKSKSNNLWSIKTKFDLTIKHTSRRCYLYDRWTPDCCQLTDKLQVDYQRSVSVLWFQSQSQWQTSCHVCDLQPSYISSAFHLSIAQMSINACSEQITSKCVLMLINIYYWFNEYLPSSNGLVNGATEVSM